MPHQLTNLLAALPHYETQSPHLSVDPTITRLTADSRQVERGTLFVAYRGVAADGHRFIEAAIRQGAAAIVCEQPPTTALTFDALNALNAETIPHIIVPDGREALAYLAAAWHDFPAQQLTMVGITGTDGKTTTTNLLYHILQAASQKVSMISTVNAVIGDTVSETGLHTTTPDALTVQGYLRQMVAAETETCLLEVTSHGLAHHRVTACEFDVAIVTNITHEHLDAHGGSIDNYWAAKAMLFESLATALDKGRPKLAILNCDDDSFGYLKGKLDPLGIRWVGYSVRGHAEAAVTATRISYRPTLTRFAVLVQPTPILGQKHQFDVTTHLIGDYNVSNCLAAITAARWGLNVSDEAIQRGVANLPGISGRMERVDEGQPFIALVDFAHTPNSLRRTLQVARTLLEAGSEGRVIAVFGCAGLRDVDKRVLMGEAAADWADVTIVTAEDPRTETLDDIIQVTVQTMLDRGAIEGQTVWRIPDRGRAIFQATQLAQAGDVVLILGKGHEQSMCFGHTEYAWDDRAALRAALRGQPLLTLPTGQARW